MNGYTAASVKQYAGCGKNFGYAYVWQSARDRYGLWKISAWINTASQTGLGKNTSTSSEVWSSGTDTLDVCTRGVGQLMVNGESYGAGTENRC